MKSTAKGATQRTLGPRDLATVKERGPLFMLSNGVYPVSTTENLHFQNADGLIALTTVTQPALGTVHHTLPVGLD